MKGKIIKDCWNKFEDTKFKKNFIYDIDDYDGYYYLIEATDINGLINDKLVSIKNIEVIKEMNLQLEDGRTIVGTKEEILDFLTNEDDGIHYKSHTKGYIKISEMATQHLKNAFLKLISENEADLRRNTAKQFANFFKGVGKHGKTMTAIGRELSLRED